MNIFNLANKFVVVFGGGGYLGSAIVKAMLGLGAKVVVADSFPDYAQKNVEEFESNPNCVLFKCDISDANQIRSAYDKCIENFGCFNTMVNLVTYGASNSIENMTDDEWNLGIDGTLTTTFRAIREVIPYFEKNDNSCIVNTGSMYGVVSPDYRIYGKSGQNNPANYGAAKAAVIQLTRYCAGHLAPKHIRVNSVTPGPFPDHRKLPPKEFLHELSKKTMLGRVGKNYEVAGAYCYLISDAASFTTGSNIVVDGGWTAW